jgi:hypothetical protein
VVGVLVCDESLAVGWRKASCVPALGHAVAEVFKGAGDMGAAHAVDFAQPRGRGLRGRAKVHEDDLQLGLQA